MSSQQLTILSAMLSDSVLSGLCGRFHSHITVRTTPDALRSFCIGRPLKATVIDLADFDGRTQRDVMTTAYHRGSIHDVGVRLAQAVTALEDAGHAPIRVKLEHESRPTLPVFTPRRYREVHVKLSIPEAVYDARMIWLRSVADDWGFVPSRNPFHRRNGAVLQFLNLRFYEGTLEDVDARTDALTTWLAQEGLSIAEVKAETVVADTAHSVDAWWA